MDQTVKEIKDLIRHLNRWTKQYDEGHPIISDKEWDDAYFKLQKLEQETGIIYPDSPTQSIFYSVVNNLEKVEHNHPMLSLDKTKDPKEVEAFVKGHEWCAMFKMDGLTCSLTYENGELVRAETRGNGIVGENILHNILVMDNVPKKIPTTETVIIDGEVICTYPNFEEFKDEYKHPRNFASGSIRLLDAKESASRNLTFVAWDLVKGCEDIDFFFWRLEKLDEWGFETVPRVGDAETVEDAIEILNGIKDRNIFPIDGYVFKFESKKYGESLGRTEHHFKNAIAFKFYDDEYETELIDIEWSMGRTGQLTPVAIFEPIDIDGTTVERASLHNVSIMTKTLGLYPDRDQPIWVAKMNQIIPQITRAIKNDTPHDHILEGIPRFCPYCGAVTTIMTSDAGVETLYCLNNQCCGKLNNRIDHFFGKKGLDVKGISTATIEKLIDWGWVNNLKDMFNLRSHEAEWIAKSGFGKASVTKILDAIDASKKNVDLASFISAIGIPLVGKTIAKTLANVCPTYQEFRDFVDTDDCYFWDFDGIGEEIDASINNFNYAEADEIAELLTFAEEQPNEPQNESSAIKDKVFCITGKVFQFKNRDALKADIESKGGKVVSSMSSKVNYLINNDSTSTSAKNKAAQAAGIPIITEDEYIKLSTNAEVA